MGEIIQFRPRQKPSTIFQAMIAQAKQKLLEQANKKKQESAENLTPSND